MGRPSDFDCDFTDNMVCPWCGYEHGDSWEFNEDSGETDCNECGKTFKFERDISITYSTSKPTAGEGGGS